LTIENSTFTSIIYRKVTQCQFYYMKLIKFAVIILLCISNKLHAQTEPIEEQWIKADSAFIGSVIHAYKTNPLGIEPLLNSKSNEKQKLGFKYYLVKGSSGKGYVSLFYDFIYFQNQLVSYRIHPEMPGDHRLTKRYKDLYAPLFSISQNQTPELLYYGYDAMCKPLNPKVKPNSLNEQIAFYMTPYSGIRYGKYGGDPLTLLENRAFYTQIKKLMTPKICELLLYSKNPATRLTAVEFYYRNIKLFTHNRKQLEKRIDSIFTDLPTVETMSADEVFTENAKNLVKHNISN
jgi:hypothetical protein